MELPGSWSEPALNFDMKDPSVALLCLGCLVHHAEEYGEGVRVAAVPQCEKEEVLCSAD